MLARGHGRYDHEKWVRQQAREEERLRRAEAAAQKAAERERKAQEVAARRAEAAQLNAQLAERVVGLESILQSGLDRVARVDLNGLVRRDELLPLDLGSRATASPPPTWSDFAPPEPGQLRSGFLGELRCRGRALDLQVVIVQPHVREGVYRKTLALHDEVGDGQPADDLLRLYLLESLLNGASASVVARGAGFVSVGDAG
jgi:hypothetical protein